MLIKKAEFGHIIWLTQEEKDNEAAVQEIKRLKSLGKVALLYSGSINTAQVLERLLQENIEQLDL